jgi:hypothetical protein
MANLPRPPYVRIELRLHPDDVPVIKRLAEERQAARDQQLGVNRQPLIDRARHAWDKGTLPHDFTPAEFKYWVRQNSITKPDGTAYAEASLHALLSNSDEKNLGSTNLNKKVLRSSKGKDGHKRFTFICGT